MPDGRGKMIAQEPIIIEVLHDEFTGGFCLSDYGGQAVGKFAHICEVVANIFENPELLK